MNEILGIEFMLRMEENTWNSCNILWDQKDGSVVQRASCFSEDLSLVPRP